LYFDSGTSNTRAYLLDKEFQVRYMAKKAVGSKDSAIAGSNRVLIEGMKQLYDEVLAANSLGEENISALYASGMVTSPYGLKEVPHLALPLTVQSFADSLYCFREDSLFHRDIYLVPGLKTISDDFSFVNNMRGEEIEIIGALDELKAENDIHDIALIMPGSHTHVTYIKGEQITGIVSNFTGELFYAIKKDTILSPVLTCDSRELDEDMVRKGIENLNRFGFNRALYICHAMRIFEQGTPQQRFSYGESVIMGGVRESLEYYCKNFWPDCRTVALVSDEFMYRLFSIIFEGSAFIDKVLWMPISETKSYAVSGLKKIVRMKGENQ
jgi:2-keto-3-deoxy-galactonokinase